MINLRLEITEVEAILTHLSKAAYSDVSALIAKVHGQSVPQVAALNASNPPVSQVTANGDVVSLNEGSAPITVA